MIIIIKRQLFVRFVPMILMSAMDPTFRKKIASVSDLDEKSVAGSSMWNKNEHGF